MEWLKASPVHVEEYLRIAAISNELRHEAQDSRWTVEARLADAAAEVTGVEDLRPRGPDPRTGTPDVAPLGGLKSPTGARLWRWFSGWRLAGALAIPAIALAAFLTGLLLGGTPARAYETAHGVQRTWQLADGTELRLNTDSAVEVQFSNSERVIDVSRGQAFFKVTHEARRRFRVIAGRAEVVAVGTRFDVYRDGETVQVTVLSGRVAVFSGDTPPPSGGVALPGGAMYLTAGQQVRIVDGAVERPSRVDLHEAEAWLRGQIAFEQLPLGEVAAEFNRYVPVPIEIDDPSLRALRVSGVFDYWDSASFLAFVRTLKTDVVIEKSPDRIRVFRR